MKILKSFVVIIVAILSLYLFNVYSNNILFLLGSLSCVFIILYKITKLSRLHNKTFELTEIAFLSSLSTIIRCFIKIAPNSSGFLPIIILSSSVMDKNYGFILGSLSIFISNIFLGQGIWTPWQMVAAGTVGYMSGFTFYNRKRSPTPIYLTTFYLTCIILIYCPIINLFSFLLITENIDMKGVGTYFLSCLVMDIFNLIGSLPFLYILYNPVVNTIGKMNKIYKR